MPIRWPLYLSMHLHIVLLVSKLNIYLSTIVCYSIATKQMKIPKKNIRDPNQHKAAQWYWDFPTITSMQVRVVTSTDYRCSAPNSVHSLKLHLFCTDFWKYWKIQRVLPLKKIGAAIFKLNMYKKVHLFSTYLNAWVAIL